MRNTRENPITIAVVKTLIDCADVKTSLSSSGVMGNETTTIYTCPELHINSLPNSIVIAGKAFLKLVVRTRLEILLF